jgi:hypothetical protein
LQSLCICAMPLPVPSILSFRTIISIDAYRRYRADRRRCACIYKIPVTFVQNFRRLCLAANGQKRFAD